MSNRYCLGIDTSNYKTSVAITDQDNNIIFEKSDFLEVEHGALGLRQSIAFFKHVNVLPSFIDEALSVVDRSKICCISVSDAYILSSPNYIKVIVNIVFSRKKSFCCTATEMKKYYFII